MLTNEAATTDSTKIQKLPRIVIGAPHGHSGKTTISIGLVGALAKSGTIVQPFKKGPDYIDPSWLSHSAGRSCRNLDCYWLESQQIISSLVAAGKTADIAVIEGAMGLFDGVDLKGTGSTAQIARITQSPVVLVVDTTRMTRSVAPLVLGFMNFDPAIKIAGVILNKIARSRHETMLRSAIEEYCGIPVLGAVPRNAYSLFPERHLGLVPVSEHMSVIEAVNDNIDIARKYLNLQAIVDIAETAPPLPEYERRCGQGVHSQVRIGVIRDQAFTFYYPENIEALELAGAELIYINSQKDRRLPDIDGLYIGGGFPEFFGEEIQANDSLRKDIKDAADYGLPIYAECGGLMYLGRKLSWQGQQWDMCGVLPFDVVLEKKPQGHGYTLMEPLQHNPFFTAGVPIKGHEFHHSRLINLGSDIQYAYRVLRGHGIDGEHDGMLYKNTFAAYNHIHALANPDWARNFVTACSAPSHNYKAC